MFDAGLKPEAIASLRRPAAVGHDRLLGLAEALWELGGVPDGIVEDVRRLVASGEDLARNAELSASDAFLAARRGDLDEFLAKISRPNPAPRQRVPLRLAYAPFRAGTCLSFRYPDGRFGAAIVVGGNEVLESEPSVVMALTSVDLAEPPRLEDVIQAHVLIRHPEDDEFEPVFVEFVQRLGDADHEAAIGALEEVGRLPVREELPDSLHDYSIFPSCSRDWDLAEHAGPRRGLERDNPHLVDRSLPVAELLKTHYAQGLGLLPFQDL